MSQEEKTERVYARLVHKLTKENLWLYILALVCEKPRYGYEMRKEIHRRFGFQPGRVTSYRVLYALERGGYIVTKREATSKEGPSRKYYAITHEGQGLLDRAEYFLGDTLGRLSGKQHSTNGQKRCEK